MRIPESMALRTLPTLPERWRWPFGSSDRTDATAPRDGYLDESERAARALSIQPIETRQFAHARSAQQYVSAWDWAIDQAVSAPDPVISNTLVTGLHHELSHELRRFMGDDSGANFHAWGAWASDHIGALIRVEAVPVLPNLSFVPPVKTYIEGRVEALSQGNREVMDDIARVMVRLIARFSNAETADIDALNRFCAETLTTGQDQLHPALTCYYKARFASTTRARQQLTYAGNLYTLEHEQHHLQTCIEEIMVPRRLRPILTRFMARISVGGREVEVSRDVDYFDTAAGHMYPPHLQALEIDDLDPFIARWGRTHTVHGSGVRDWVELAERFNFLMHICRVYHTNPTLYETPLAAHS